MSKDTNKYTNKYTRIPTLSPFGVYEGFDNDGRHSIFVKIQSNVKIAKKTKFLDTRVGKRKDGKWALTISLYDDKLYGVFSKLIADLVSVVENIENEIVAERYFIQRYKEWQLLFEKNVNETLDYSEIIGLIGELVFIKLFMIPNYGVESAINSWVGPLGADKDFFIDNTWYEIKTKSLNKPTVHVNSKTQLQSNTFGFLSIVNYEKGTKISNHSLNLITLYEELLSLISSSELEREFHSKLASLNFVPNIEYENYNYIIHSIDRYLVDQNFPQFKETNIPVAISNLEYDLYLPEIQNWKVED